MSQSYTQVTAAYGIDTLGPALDVQRCLGGQSIVRPTRDGRFAIVRLRGNRAKLFHIVATLSEALCVNLKASTSEW